jgi:hypothetical protein
MRSRSAIETSSSRPNSVREDLEALRRAAELRQWSEFVRDVPAQTERFRRVTETVESRWNTLIDDDQDLVLLLRDMIQQAVESPPQPSIVQRFVSHLTRTSDEEKRQIRRLLVTVGGFIAVVDHQLREEERLRKLLGDFAATDATAIATIERGVAEASAGVGNTYTLEEFRTRFGLS